MKEEMYKRIIEELISIMDEGVYIVDSDGIGLFYNEAMEKMEEIAKENVIGKPFSKAFPGVKLNDSTIYRALKKGLPTTEKEQSYVNLYGKNIATVNRTTPVFDDGYIVGAVEVAKDITNIKSMSNTILELRESTINPKKVTPKIKKYSFDDLIGNNSMFSGVISRAKKAAKNDANVFIFGETGTGKELFSQSIHYDSSRKNRPFIAQNCAAIPESLLEGLLFGTSKGSFTGAEDRAGLFEQANGGTLLLDEISAMPYELQSKLLRVLQEDYIRRVGGNKDIPIDVRIIATVNESPSKLIEQGKLRQDLYYRLNIVNITIPPLRERLDDIPLLADHFIKKHNKRFDKEIWMISDEAIMKLKKYNYPGNVREMENIIMQSVSMAENEHILTDKMLQMPVPVKAITKDLEGWNERGPLDDYIASIEKEIIRETMIEESGNISRASARLGMKRQTLQHKLKKYEIKE